MSTLLPIIDRFRLMFDRPYFVIPLCILIATYLLSGFASPVQAEQVRLLHKKHDP